MTGNSNKNNPFNDRFDTTYRTEVEDEGQVVVEESYSAYTPETEKKEVKWWKKPLNAGLIGLVVGGIIFGGIAWFVSQNDTKKIDLDDTSISTLELQVENLQSELDALQADKEKIVKEKEELEGKLAGDDEANTTLQSDIDSVRAELSETQNKLAAAEASLEGAQKSASDWEEITRALAKQLIDDGKTPVVTVPEPTE